MVSVPQNDPEPRQTESSLFSLGSNSALFTDYEKVAYSFNRRQGELLHRGKWFTTTIHGHGSSFDTSRSEVEGTS